MLQRILYFILIFSFFSCNKENNDIPSYVKIDDVDLLYNQDFGANTENITDVWFYIDDNLQGVYEMPVEFPILNEGIQNIRIKAGVKANGIASTRIQYPFYNSYFDTIELNQDESKIISPIFTYNDEFTPAPDQIEDFESSGTIIDSTLNSEIDFSIISENQNHYAYAKIDTPNINFEASTQDLILPQQGAPVYLEIDYKSSTEFLVGMYINYSQDVVKRELLWVTPKQDWNKIYINLTSTVSESIGAVSFKVFINMRRNDPSISEEISFDNVKILY
ncbi:MAG: hypothetical protein P8J77_03455 [Flavobacteriales bacterium]|jgi:hypothetical protein|nr:hypothetical protein [Flavobacteriales bacterium]